MMRSIGLLKGQPYRFGTIDERKNSSDQQKIHYISDQLVEQSKIASDISLVNAKEAFLSSDLGMCKMLFNRFSKSFSDVHSAGLWECISPDKNSVVLISRQYLLKQIAKALPTSMDDALNKLESRKILQELENSWNKSIISPKVIASLFCSNGWDSKSQILYTMPYRAIPLGRVESVEKTALKSTDLKKLKSKEQSSISIDNPISSGGLVYRSDSYPHGSFNVDLTSSEARLNGGTSDPIIYIIYIDTIRDLKAGVSWPTLLKENISPKMKNFIDQANVLVIDSQSKIKNYETGLRRTLKTDIKSAEHVLPCCNFSKDDILESIQVDTLYSYPSFEKMNKTENSQIQISDLGALMRALQDLYPACNPEESISNLVITKAIKQFGYTEREKETNLSFTGKTTLPTSFISPSFFYFMYGQSRKLLENLINDTSLRLLIRKSDLSDECYGQLQDRSDDHMASLLRISSKKNSIKYEGLDLQMTLNLLRELRKSRLENPYKLVKLIDIPKLNERFSSSSNKLSILLLEDI